ncbi:D-sedoheptulose-7-phosphate isomerase [Janibacter cremeus]|uniref:D-sedoheptulose 7-phosphate isomerase n=1 Tax=Janibacter cremeus TaxID=1285192 RepID=A0A852VW50_9MICO|nr:SIS domain-containing protein [Janibacter cremeus]NYF99610.1 D-sedoheptulose 7-phosphate isomerase [Janibacter cremeus]
MTMQDSTGPDILATRLDAGIAAWGELAAQVAQPDLRERARAAGGSVLAALAAGHTLLVAGNGGSAAISSHIAAEFLGKCVVDRHPLPAISLAESPASLTAIGNDYGFDEVFVRGVQAFGRPGDVLLAMSTSGASPNIIAALAEARSRGLGTILMTGEKGAGRVDLADHLLAVPSRETPRIQEVHMLWAHSWCEAVDHAMQEQG